MYTEKDLQELKHEYQQTKAPEQLRMEAEKMMKQTKIRKFTPGRVSGLAAACAAFIFIAGVNVSPTFAETLKGVPILGTAAEFVTFRAYEDITEDHEMKIDQAEIRGLDNKELQNSLNNKYADQAKTLYNDFMERINGGVENISMLSEYSVKADNGVTMSVEHSTFIAQASGSETLEYDTIDTQNQIYITLPGLFQDDSYIELISQEIKKQMAEQTKADNSRVFFTEEFAFDKIDHMQQFYINNDHKLVISFNEADIAPAFMGTQEFVIPTAVIQDALVSNEYIR